MSEKMMGWRLPQGSIIFGYFYPDAKPKVLIVDIRIVMCQISTNWLFFNEFDQFFIKLVFFFEKRGMAAFIKGYEFRTHDSFIHLLR